jgi:hypothetical protein
VHLDGGVRIAGLVTATPGPGLALVRRYLDPRAELTRFAGAAALPASPSWRVPA